MSETVTIIDTTDIDQIEVRIRGSGGGGSDDVCQEKEKRSGEGFAVIFADGSMNVHKLDYCMTPKDAVKIRWEECD